MRAAIILAACVMLTLCCSCSDPNLLPGTAVAWKKNMSEGILPGYSDFQAHWMDGDIAAYIFSYTCPDPTTNVPFEVIKGRIPSFTVHQQTESKLVLRKPVDHSRTGGFDEWHFLHDAESSSMTVLYANLDSAAERKCHSEIIEELTLWHSKKYNRYDTEQEP